MPDRNQRNRYNRPERSPYRERDDRSWRQQEQFSNGQRDWNYNDYEEGYGRQMSEPYGRSDYGQRQADYEAAWDRNERIGREGPGYTRREPNNYPSAGEYNYGPAYYDTGSGRGYTSFTTEDQAGHDFTSPTTGDYRNYGRGMAYSDPGYGYGYGSASRRQYERPEHERGWFERAGDEVASWFGDEDAARRREMDHTGRGPAGYTRSDERILEDANDNLTDDWAVDARKVTVTVENGEITLDGTVPTREQKRRAEDCVEDISGVRHVQNNLRVQERSEWDRSDETRAEGEKTTGSLT
jgi:osmotically-inducible protein OsmY